MKRILAIVALAAAGAMVSTVALAASNTVKVTPNDVPGATWSIGDQRGTGGYQFVEGPGQPPLGRGSLELSTPLATDKITLLSNAFAGTALADVDAIRYSTYRFASSTASAFQLPAINVEIDSNGSAPGGFATLVYEPVYNDRDAIADDTWQDHDAYDGGQGIWWSTRPIGDVCAFDCFVTWDEIVANAPDGVVGRVGVNQGSGNGGLTSAVDALTFGAGGDLTTYDFEPLTGPPASKDECKDGGWESFDNPTFRNQGDCVSYVATGGRH